LWLLAVLGKAENMKNFTNRGSAGVKNIITQPVNAHGTLASPIKVSGKGTKVGHVGAIAAMYTNNGGAPFVAGSALVNKIAVKR
jgi:hypothetical protein